MNEVAKEAQRQGKGGTEGARPAGEGQQAPPGPVEGLPKAVEESEQVKENAGITIGADGQAQNLGGNLGFSKGSDGNTFVSGKAGITSARAVMAGGARTTETSSSRTRPRQSDGKPKATDFCFYELGLEDGYEDRLQ
ncbi:hypothetical protein CTA1_11808 [Colletotrichum tanaceti]|uniref:Uncharacterized protein n=1 Tax=Colletotrichum tanaceti TaxID=1306861 RepID=A0A4U6X0S0_9PEZI|nr:hypothetical protein CTA1_11808 [Colletotrichum tanaceti]